MLVSLADSKKQNVCFSLSPTIHFHLPPDIDDEPTRIVLAV